MERVSGDSGAIASSTNSCGTALRCLVAKRVSSAGKETLSRQGFDMGGWVARFYVGVSDTAFPARQPGYEVDIMGHGSAPAEKATAVQRSSLQETICHRLHMEYTSTSWAKRANSLSGQRTARTTLAWWRSRK